MFKFSKRQIASFMFILCLTFDMVTNVSSSGRKRGVGRFLPKTEHEREVLKSVADRIYGMLNSAHYQKHRIERGSIASEDAGDMLASVLSMVLDRDGRAPQVESEARILETLSHFIAEESERLRKRQDVAHLSPNMSTELRSGRKSFLDYFKINFGATTARPAPHNNTKSFVEAVSGMLPGSMIPENERLRLREMTPDVKVEPFKEDSQIHTKQAVSPIYTSNMLANEEEEATTMTTYLTTPEAEDPVLRLTPHVIFTDAEGREYRLIGVGGRGSPDCSRECLTVDGSSRNVLAYKKPTTASEFLVLAAPGGMQLFTSGVQVCDSDGSNLHSMDSIISGPDFSLLHPQSKRGAHELHKKAIAKRADKSNEDDFGQEVQALYNGDGLSERLAKKSTSPNEVLKSVKNKRSRMKRQKQISVIRRRRGHKLTDRNARRLRTLHKLYDEDDRLFDDNIDEPSNPIQDKLLSNLGKYNNNLEQYSKGGKAKIDVDRCKRHCEDMGAHIDRIADFGDTVWSRSKRNADFDLLPREDISSQPVTETGSCPDCDPKEFLSKESVDLNRSGVDSNGYKVITFEADNKDTGGESANPPMSDEEFNMIQPTTTADDEDRILLATDIWELTSERTNEEHTDVPSRKMEKPSNDVQVDEDSKRIGYEDLNARADLEWEAMPSDEKIENSSEPSDYTTQPSAADTWIKNNWPVDVSPEPEGETVAVALEENVKARVENSPEINRIVGPALKLILPAITQPTPQVLQYSSAFDILMKTFMVNVEKIAEDELAGRNCVRLSSDLQEYLSHLLALPIHGSAATQYQENIAQVPTYQDLALRKNKLVSLLKEFTQLSPKEQMETMGVKGFLESELGSIGKQPSPEIPPNDQHKRSMPNSADTNSNHLTTSRPKFEEYKEAARNWLENMKKSVMSIREMNVFHAKPYSEIKPYPQPDAHTQQDTGEGALLQTGGKKEGIVVSTVAEASFFAQNGFVDIVLGRPITPHLLNRCQHLKESTVKFLVNSEEGARTITDASSGDNPISALLKISTGYERAGIPWNAADTITSLARKLTQSPFVNFLGLYAHCGNSYTSDKSQVVKVRDETVERIIGVRDLLREGGIACEEVGIGSTPSCSLPVTPILSQLTEVHTGNYAFYDIQQESYGACSREDIAGRVMTRVVSHSPNAKQLIVDLGFTGLTKQGLDLAVPGYAAIDNYPQLKLAAMTQELGKIEKIDGSSIDCSAFPVDTPLFVLPYHACATAGMHPHYYVHDDQGIVCDVWVPVRGW